MAQFENMDHRLDKINATLMEYGMGTLDDAEKVCKDAGMDPLPYDIVKSVQPICRNSSIFFSRSCLVTSNICARQSMQRYFVAPRLMSLRVRPTSSRPRGRPQLSHVSTGPAGSGRAGSRARG